MRKKAYLELCITLIIGILIGFLANSIITDKRIREFSIHQGEWNFWRRALVEIEATDEQKEAIIPIIKEYSGEAHKIMHKSWEDIVPIIDEMDKMVMNELTAEQQHHVLKIKEHRDEIRKKNMRKNKDPREKGPIHEYRNDPRERPDYNHEDKRTCPMSRPE